MKGSIIIVSFFVAGIICGQTGVLPLWLADSSVTMVALCMLLLCVGAGIGSNPDIRREFSTLHPCIVLLPLATIIGSWAGAMAACIIVGRGLTDCLAVGSGFAYYSLSSIFITEYRGAELGTIALIANVIREMTTLLAAPLIARWLGPLAPISAGGATSMDTTLPILSRTCGQQYTVVAVFHGFIVDFSVPFLVTMWCMI